MTGCRRCEPRAEGGRPRQTRAIIANIRRHPDGHKLDDSRHHELEEVRDHDHIVAWARCHMALTEPRQA